MSDFNDMYEEKTEERRAGKTKESKSEKFERLASKKINQILDELEQLGSLSNAKSYEYTPEQVNSMFSAIERKIAEVKKEFAPKKREGHFSF